MTITIFLEIAIGMVMIWTTLALAVMGFQEWLAGVLKWRAKDLENAIRGMLEDPEKIDYALPIVDEIYKHPLIQALSEPAEPGIVDKIYKHLSTQALSKPAEPGKAQQEKKKHRRKPSYIPDRLFALALFDVVMTAGTDESVIQAGIYAWGGKLEELRVTGEVPPRALKAVGEALPRLREVTKGASRDLELLAEINAEVMRIRAELTAKYPVLGPALDELPQYLTSQQIIEGVANLAVKNPIAAEALSSLMAEGMAFAEKGETALAAFRTNVETWFNHTMDRLTGRYKRKMQDIAFIIGLILAVLLNVDSMGIATTLWREPTVRAALVAQAEALEKQLLEVEDDQGAAIAALNQQLENVALPVGWTWMTPDQGQQCALVPRTLSYAWGIRVGAECLVPVDAPQDIPAAGIWVSKAAGWVLSGAAASMGAPFWFEILKKLVNIRSSGKNPAEESDKKAGE